ncbi:MAG: GNAT family N-acetyltransferase [Armatimonadetes bacterium]|nr:GNAT family N-acetyltransferase [Armatimonadota bacterium]
MLEQDRRRFPPVPAALKDGRVVVIRHIAGEDADAFADFYEAIPRADVRFYCPHPLTRERAAEEAAAADHPFRVRLVAVDDGGVIAGCAHYGWRDAESPAGGFGICCRRGYQGCGLGRALMTRILEIAREVGPPLMYLTVQKTNARAVALYQSMGFEIVREQVRRAFDEFPAEPEYFMQRPTR